MAIKDLEADQLRSYIASHHERDYLLVDVRQPAEYQNAHIPGAQLIPLPELVQMVDRLPADRTLVFYCHSGGRSAAAAAMAEEEVPAENDIFNLSGGILAWDGGMVADVPNVRLFADQGRAEMFKTAMDLEKGALRFYTEVGRLFDQAPWVAVFKKLAKAEHAHARTVHSHWRRSDSGLPAFEALFEQLEGEVLEGGRPLADALADLSRIREQACLRLVELALKIEFSAFDLYRSMADQVDDADAQAAFLDIAQAEKAHMRSLIDAIETCRD